MARSAIVALVLLLCAWAGPGGSAAPAVAAAGAEPVTVSSSIQRGKKPGARRPGLVRRAARRVVSRVKAPFRAIKRAWRARATRRATRAGRSTSLQLSPARKQSLVRELRAAGRLFEAKARPLSSPPIPTRGAPSSLGRPLFPSYRPGSSPPGQLWGGAPARGPVATRPSRAAIPRGAASNAWATPAVRPSGSARSTASFGQYGSIPRSSGTSSSLGSRPPSIYDSATSPFRGFTKDLANAPVFRRAGDASGSASGNYATLKLKSTNQYETVSQPLGGSGRRPGSVGSSAGSGASLRTGSSSGRLDVSPRRYDVVPGGPYGVLPASRPTPDPIMGRLSAYKQGVGSIRSSARRSTSGSGRVVARGRGDE